MKQIDISKPLFPIRYCSKCGKQMIADGEMTFKQDKSGYDIFTGKIATIFKQKLKCPDYSFWSGHAYGELAYNSERRIWV